MKRVIVLILLLTSITFTQESKKIVVGSKSFTESRILGEIIAQLIEARTEIEVGRKHGLAGSVVTFNAIKNGDIDIYPEYTGTAWSAILKRKDTSSDPLKTYVEVKRILEKEHGLTVTAPFGFNNTYIVAVRPETAEDLGLKTVSDIKGNESKLRFGWSTEFLNRPDGWPGLVKTYNLENVSVRGMEHGLAYQAIGSGNVDVIDAYSTDGKLRELKLTFLTDDKKFFPPYHAAPAVRVSTLEKYPEIGPLLNELSYRIDEEAMQSLNHEVEEEEKAFESVAKAFLVREKLIDSDAETTKGENIGSGTLTEFISARITDHPASDWRASFADCNCSCPWNLSRGSTWNLVDQKRKTHWSHPWNRRCHSNDSQPCSSRVYDPNSVARFKYAISNCRAFPLLVASNCQEYLHRY